MPKITFILRDGEEVDAEAPIGLSVMEVAQKSGIRDIEGACGGSLACATCHVYTEPAHHEALLPEDGMSEDEEDMLDMAFDLRETSRLCCQIMVSEEIDGFKFAVPGAPKDWT
jgi:2Fe-2S ferredoxin